jgi:thiol-disulfide isomerase/thioredoxin
MRWAAFVIITILVSSVALAATAPSFNGQRRPFTLVEPVKPAPLTPMYTANGGIINLSRFKGKVVLLNLWATWCAPCLKELPELDRLQSELSQHGLAVLPLAIDDADMATLQSFFQRLHIKALSPLSDPAGRAASAFDAYDGLPWSYIIDRQGQLRGYMPGAANWNSVDGRALLKHYLDQP